LYRTSGPVIEEIVVERRSRPRARRYVFVVPCVLFAYFGLMIVYLHAKDASQFIPFALAIVAILAAWIAVRTRSLVVVRAGKELRIRDGRRRSVVLVGEVHEVEIDTRGERAHAVVLVLDGHRRLELGDPFERMSDAVAERRTLRNALTRP
jgi:hypothetical protein